MLGPEPLELPDEDTIVWGAVKSERTAATGRTGAAAMLSTGADAARLTCTAITGLGAGAVGALMLVTEVAPARGAR